MSTLKIKTDNSPEGSQNSSTIEPEENDSSATDYMVIQCDNLLKHNHSTYTKCVNFQEKLKLQLIRGNVEYKSFRSLLENANEDYFTIESNQGRDLIQIYEILLKKKFVSDFFEHGTARERVNLKYLNLLMRCKELGRNLKLIDGDVTSLKLKYEEIQYCETLLQFAPAEEAIEYSRQEKGLRLRYVNVIYECENLSTCLSETCEEIEKLYSEHKELVRFYRVLLQDSAVKEFLNYANEEKLRSESTEKTKNCECFKSPHDQADNENVVFLNSRLKECQEKLIIEQRRREQIEKEYCSMDELSDKLCWLLLKYQRRLKEITEKFYPNNDSIEGFYEKNSSVLSSGDAMKEYFTSPVSKMCAAELKEENSKNMSLDEEFIVTKFEEDNRLSQEQDILPNNHSNSRFQNHESFAKKIAPDSLVEEHDTFRIEKRDLIVKKEHSSGEDDQLDSLHTSTHWPDEEFPTMPSKLLNQQNEVKDINVGKHERKSASGATKTNSRKLKCSTCGKKFWMKSELAQHERIHTDSRPYDCVDCGKKFRQQSHLIQHLRIHSNEKSFSCLQCGKTFRQLTTLNQHKRIHSGEKPFVCGNCGKRFSQKSNCNTHMRSCD